MHCNLAFTTYC